MNDKERLEEIKELVKKIESILYDEWRQQELTILIESLYYDDHVKKIANKFGVTFQTVSDIKLEKRWKHLTNPQAEKIELLNAEIKTLQAKWEAQGLMIQKLHRENQRYKQALEFYADERNHEREWDTFADSGVEKSEVMKDGGEKARQALKGE